jgi:hypothetical protein
MIVVKTRGEPGGRLGAQLVVQVWACFVATTWSNGQENSEKSVQISKEKWCYRVYMSKFRNYRSS